MKILLNETFDLRVKHSSSNQLKFGNGRAYRPKEYTQNYGEMLSKFMEIDFDIPEKRPLGVGITYYYPAPKKGGKPTTRSTKDLDSTKAVLDSLMTAGIKKGQKFDDSQVIIEFLSKKYWDKDYFGLKLIVVEMEDDSTNKLGDSYYDIGKYLGGLV